MESYRLLARQLNTLPEGYPAVEGGLELKILEKLFTPEEASLASQMMPHFETLTDLANRIELAPAVIYPLLKDMVRKGLIKIGRKQGRLAFSLMPFVVGIYEMQAGRIDQELAALFEAYFQNGLGRLLSQQPPVHRVIPIQQGVRQDIEILPYENAGTIIDQAQAWGVVDCICRTQKALIGDPCNHPVDVCLVMSEYPDAFRMNDTVRSQSKEEAHQTLQRAAAAGLVHSVSNTQEGLWYICNCCTCSCGILRGMAEFGFANVIARSSFVLAVDQALCTTCGSCVEACPFDALHLDDTAVVDPDRCTGCGVCIASCPADALSLAKRPEEQVKQPPLTAEEWGKIRTSMRAD